MAAKILVGCLVVFATANMVAAIEQGDLVVARRDVPLVVSGTNVDQVGPGQVLRVLEVKDSKIWVSRGRPGWIATADVIPLEAAEAYFNRPFATGAGARDYLSRGTVRIALGKQTEGLADLEKAVGMANEPGDYLESLGFAQLAAQDQPAAIETFGRAIEDEPASAPALMGRGLAYYQAGQNQKAIDDFYRAIEINPQHAFPRKYLGALYHDLGKLDLAREQLDVAVKLDAYDVFSRKARGRLLFDQGDYKTALDDFFIAAKIDSMDVEAIAGRGVVRHALGSDLNSAEADFSAAIKLTGQSAENAYLWSNLGQVQFELRKFEDARRSLDQALILDSNFNEARSHRAYLLATISPDTSQIAAAKADVQAVFGNNEARTFWDYRALAAVNAAMGDYTRAAKYLALGEAVLRKSGPVRFIEPTVVARQNFERKRLPAR